MVDRRATRSTFIGMSLPSDMERLKGLPAGNPRNSQAEGPLHPSRGVARHKCLQLICAAYQVPKAVLDTIKRL